LEKEGEQESFVWLPTKEFRNLKSWVSEVLEGWEKVLRVKINVWARKNSSRANLAGFPC